MSLNWMKNALTAKPCDDADLHHHSPFLSASFKAPGHLFKKKSFSYSLFTILTYVRHHFHQSS